MGGCSKAGCDVRGRRREQAALGCLPRSAAQRRLFQAGVGPRQATMQQPYRAMGESGAVSGAQ